MDQTRQDSTPHHSVCFHMHHMCVCPNIYPPLFYPPNYRGMVPYGSSPRGVVPRTYLRQYHYMQYNLNGNYNLPWLTQTLYCPQPSPLLSIAATSSTSPITTTTTTTTGTSSKTAIKFVSSHCQQMQPLGALLDNASVTTSVSRPDFSDGSENDEEFISSENMNSSSNDSELDTENFIKFIEKSCLEAEQIAYRNRNRPCFRNIENLCIRTRTEINKPRTTVSNIHSQGIPWATKDFIYAFVRLTNCWHILKGYWENRNGMALGKIEKELTPNFKSCYVRWEKETVQLATELSRIFYNLDMNQSIQTTNNLPKAFVPPQVTLRNFTNERMPASKITTTPSVKSSASMSTNSTQTKTDENVIHLISKTTNQVNLINQNKNYKEIEINENKGNDTKVKDNTNKEEDDKNNNSGNDNNDVNKEKNYMKPGSYYVPKKLGTRREIEFLDTAQNVSSKNLESVRNKYWVQQLDLYDVNEWINTSNFSNVNENEKGSEDATFEKLSIHNITSAKNNNVNQAPIKTNNNKKIYTSSNYHYDFQGSKTYRRKFDDVIFEMKNGGLSKRAKLLLEKIIVELKGTELVGILVDGFLDYPSLEMIQNKLIKDDYFYINEVIRDIRHVIRRGQQHFQKCGYTDEQIEVFPKKLQGLIDEYFPNCDFSNIKGDHNEIVGKLKFKINHWNNIQNYNIIYNNSNNNNDNCSNNYYNNSKKENESADVVSPPLNYSSKVSITFSKSTTNDKKIENAADIDSDKDDIVNKDEIKLENKNEFSKI